VGAGQDQARNERTTKDLRRQIAQARPTQLNRHGSGHLPQCGHGASEREEQDPGLKEAFARGCGTGRTT